ncbi:MAG: AI-2E family transporter [Deltaproteobacteria bacterium]|jgi:predicted PurR-regulated permease PerM|nr:AI-2E family transporter [Deltaproteobacteria bacterium]
MANSRGARIVLMLASIVAIGAGIKLAAPLLVPVLVASFIAIVTAPIVMWFCDRGVPTLLAVLAGLLLDVAAGAALGIPLAGAVATFTERVPDYAAMLAGRMDEAELWLAARGIYLESVYDFSEPTWMFNMATVMAQYAASLVSQMVLVLLIVAFMLFEATGIREKLARIATPSQIQELSSAAREVNTYLVAKTVLSLLTGLLVFAWCLWREVDVPLLWGLLAYLLNYIPTVGQVIASVPAIALAWLQLGPGEALVVAAGFGAINLAIGAVEPRVMGGALGLSPLVVLVSMVVWGWLLGPVGALVSAPLTMVIKHALAHSEQLRWMAELLGPTPRPSGKAAAGEADSADELSRA